MALRRHHGAPQTPWRRQQDARPQAAVGERGPDRRDGGSPKQSGRERGHGPGRRGGGPCGSPMRSTRQREAQWRPPSLGLVGPMWPSSVFFLQKNGYRVQDLVPGKLFIECPKDCTWQTLFVDKTCRVLFVEGPSANKALRSATSTRQTGILR